MKTIKTWLCLLLLTGLSSQLRAQCGCEDPATGGTVSYTISIPVNNVSTNYIKVPQFDPADGHVTCVNIDYTYTLISNLFIRNSEPNTKIYSFLYSISPSVNIGSQNFVETEIRMYGPTTLAPHGEEGDSITYGPDTIAFDRNRVINSGINPAAFMGTDTTTMTFEFSGGVNSITGGVNFEQIISTVSWATFEVTLSWCPNSVLNTQITDFQVRKYTDAVQVNWRTSGDDSHNSYYVQVSTDGKNFTTVNTHAITSPGTGNYQYNFSLNNNDKTYIRIMQVNAEGKVTYSPIRIIQSDGVLQPPVQIFPNPAKDHINIQFQTSVDDIYQIELYNTAGQQVFRQQKLIQNQSNIDVKLPPLPTGVYYLRINGANNKKEIYHSKVYITI